MSHTDGYHEIRMACEKCGRFVKGEDVEVIDYRADEGFYGTVIDGHSSHPECGAVVPVAVVYGRFIPTPEASRS